MAEGAATEDSNEGRIDVQGSPPTTKDFPPPNPIMDKLEQLINNNNPEMETKSCDAPIVQIQVQVVVDKDSQPSSLDAGQVSSEALRLSVRAPSSSCDDGSISGGGDTSDTSTRRHSKSSSLPHGVKLCPEGTPVTIPSGENTAAEKWIKLEEELRKAHEDLQAKDDEVEKLKGIRQLVEDELHDLTSSLFVEAHKMVSEAKMKEISSEKSLRETKMQLDGLQAEVAALKTLLITSTPSKPNLGNGKSGISTIFKKQHKRTPSHNHLLYGRADEADGKTVDGTDKSERIDRERSEVDPILHSLFATWRDEPTLSKSRSEFLKKVYEEDIEPCIQFQNPELVKRLMVAIEENSIWVDPLPEKSKSNVPKECALLQVPRLCHYRMRFAFDSDEAFDISQLCRDRVAVVCEFLNYLRYIKNGLVKASVDDSYWEIIHLRKQMALAKLGLPISS